MIFHSSTFLVTETLVNDLDHPLGWFIIPLLICQRM